MTDRDNITLPREVARLALSYIEWYIENEDGGRFVQVREAEAILRKALAAEQPKPEPVGWHYQNSAGYSIVHWRPSATLDADMQAAKDYPNTHKVTPLYTAPPEDEALRRDAERYRWLRDNAAGFSGRTLDAVTDAALRREALR